ncbi:hypothetical protein Vafri_14818 [Volvox africanus]|uniref:Uncharacterized protein n=1 Tax=Volvox africanus TaxID=51714 RepID=A0A8J4BEZ8_9CHLO|nr:hypothetical protein Vafri_14818 [Volvox africanus]
MRHTSTTPLAKEACERSYTGAVVHRKSGVRGGNGAESPLHLFPPSPRPGPPFRPGLLLRPAPTSRPHFPRAFPPFPLSPPGAPPLNFRMPLPPFRPTRPGPLPTCMARKPECRPITFTRPMPPRMLLASTWGRVTAGKEVLGILKCVLCVRQNDDSS